MGHMRSRSSLLAHILLNDENMYGIGESNKTYKNKIYLIKMRMKVRLYSRIFIPTKFIFVDQINHNRKTPSSHLIRSFGKIIFLARTPEESFESIRNLTKQFYKEWSHDQIEEYYLSRLRYLVRLKMSAPNSISINSEFLISKTDECLKELSVFLNLKTQLSTTYKVRKYTGINGDPSMVIKTGKVVKKRSTTYEKNIAHECFTLFEQLIE